MGLIDVIRKKRDSWISRFEEQRQEDYDDNFKTLEGEVEELTEEQIQKNREMVGKFERNS